MTKAKDAIQYSRAIQCTNLSYLGTTDLKSFLEEAKDDWNLRAEHDASSYVCASPRASEAEIRSSGYGDVLREFVTRCPITTGSLPSLLELGCGFGRMTRELVGWCNKLYAVDISGELLAQARARMPLSEYPNVEFIETDGMHLDGVPDGSIWMAFEYIVFQHISVPEVITSYIREVDKKLVNGFGRFVMHGRDVAADESGASLGNTWHGCRCGPELVRKSIEGTNLTIVKEEGVGTDRYWVTLQKGM